MDKVILLNSLLDLIRALEGYEVFDAWRDYLVDFYDIDQQLTLTLNHLKEFRASLSVTDELINFFEGHGAAGVMFDNVELARPNPKFAAALDELIALVEAAII